VAGAIVVASRGFVTERGSLDDQGAGTGVLLSNVISLDGHVPRRGDLVEYRTINAAHKPYIVAWVDGSRD